MAELPEDDRIVVKMWWQRCKERIFVHGFTLENYHPPSQWPILPGKCRSFRDILTTEEGKISANAKSNGDQSPFKLTVWWTTPNNTGGVKYFQVDQSKEVFEVASGNVVSVRHERAILVELGVTPVELIDCGGFPECLDYQRPADTNQTL